LTRKIESIELQVEKTYGLISLKDAKDGLKVNFSTPEGNGPKLNDLMRKLITGDRIRIVFQTKTKIIAPSEDEVSSVDAKRKGEENNAKS